MQNILIIGANMKLQPVREKHQMVQDVWDHKSNKLWRSGVEVFLWARREGNNRAGDVLFCGKVLIVGGVVKFSEALNDLRTTRCCRSGREKMMSSGLWSPQTPSTVRTSDSLSRTCVHTHTHRHNYYSTTLEERTRIYHQFVAHNNILFIHLKN